MDFFMIITPLRYRRIQCGFSCLSIQKDRLINIKRPHKLIQFYHIKYVTKSKFNAATGCHSLTTLDP